MQLARRYILYDGECVVCRRLKHLALQHLSVQSTSWATAPIQPFAMHKRIVGVPEHLALESMHVLDQDLHYHGFDAICYIICRGYSNSFAWHILHSPVIYKLGNRIYQWVARNRPCQNQCPIPQ